MFELTAGQAVVIGLRLVVPLLILRRPLLGGVVAMLLDGADVIIVEQISDGGMGQRYHLIDKYLDLYYLGLEAFVSRRWTEPMARQTSLILFAYRLLGVLLFEATQSRRLLIYFPNLFENWFLFYLLKKHFAPQLRLDSWRKILFWLAVLAIPKLAQEYLLHVRRAQPWDWFKDSFLGI